MEQLKSYVPGKLLAVPEVVYDEILRSVTAAGASSPEDAEILADAVLGPLGLVPPPPSEDPQWLWESYAEKSGDDFCLARYFTAQGEWKYCALHPGHEAEMDHGAFKPDDDVTWDDDDRRAIPRDYR